MKRGLFLILTVSFIFLTIKGISQPRPKGTIVYGNGTNHFMGDLGGGKYEAAHFMGIRDLDYQVTRPTWQIGYRYMLFQDRNKENQIFFRATYTYALITGKDKASGYIPRQARNLSFRSGVYELGGQFEYYFLSEKRYTRVIRKTVSSRNIAAYFFLGGGALYFNPKGYYEPEGKWIALRPLGTEGQYANPDGSPYEYKYSKNGQIEILQTPKPYSRIAAYLAVGLGIKLNINPNWAIGLEISNRYTSTDYLDDAHDRYFNYEQFGLTPPSPYTSYFADKHLPYHYDENGEMVIDGTEPAETKYVSGKPGRGNPDYNDAYILTLITVYYNLKGAKKGKPKYR